MTVCLVPFLSRDGLQGLFPFRRKPRCSAKWRQARRGTQALSRPRAKREPTLWQGLFCVGAGVQAELSAKAFHVEHGAYLAYLAGRREGPERHCRYAQHLVTGGIAQRGLLDGADE